MGKEKVYQICIYDFGKSVDVQISGNTPCTLGDEIKQTIKDWYKQNTDLFK